MLDFNGQTRTISVTTTTGVPTGLRIDTPILTGGIVKTGSGTLILNSGGSTFTGGVDLQAGTLELGDNNVLGGGTLTIEGGSVIMGVSGQTVTNPVTVTGDFYFRQRRLERDQRHARDRAVGRADHVGPGQRHHGQHDRPVAAD